MAAAFIMLGTPGWVGLVYSCGEALRDSDLVYARSTERLVFHYGEAEAERATRCLDQITGQSHYFDRTLSRLIPENQRPNAEAEKAIRAAQEAVNAAARKAQQEADAAEKNRFERLRVGGLRLKSAREAAAITPPSEGCTNMYRRDPDATTTNQLCLDVFFRTGLPD
ncbi:hypothetical protein [Paracoccus sp. (in: a-proteobacteria)]|uniref:hypothetical protein n=1 Tax=Paracoccus sp. TaxID=267 RepID=UPI0026DEB4AB|nr:hypothetical protein [Paracoccus sp. (in: a-proteobacteria)]MDO5370248.1 hypothetical protein [Paracoccus sp. (in: a-proteobacteria)]